MRLVSLVRARWLPRATAALALCLVLAPMASAEIAPKAKPVLERYLQAMGPGYLSERSLHTRDSIQAFGMRGVAETWKRRPDRVANRFDLGPFKVRTGYDGSAGWRTDMSGKVLLLDGKDLEDAKSGAWFDAESWLLPDQGGGRIDWVGEETDSIGRYVVLEITPPQGRPRRLYFDPSTGLLAKEVAKHDQQIVVTRSSDYRRVDGRMIPYRSATEMVGQPMNTIVTTLDSAWVNEEIPDAIFAPPTQPGGGAPRYLKTPGIARVPFEYRERHVWIRASVNGGPAADFIFDTGASITVIDSAYAASIGLATEGRQQGQGAGATGSASFASLRSLRIESADGDGIEMPDVKVAVLGINGFLAPYFWKDCAGIVGFDVIDRFVDEIDYDGRMLTLHDPATFHYQGKGTAIPMTLAGHTPVVTMRLDGRTEGDFRVDVGSGSTVDLHTPFVKKLGLDQARGRSVEMMGGGFGGTFRTRIVRMKKLEIGPYSWTDPLVSLSEATEGAFTSEDYAGNIGNRLLERFHVTLDYDHRQLWLEPGARYPRRDPFTRTGLQFGRYGDTVKVMAVIEGSPAERAGVRADDVVTAIDGRPISSFTPDDILSLLDEGAPGRTITLTVIRDGASKKIGIKLKEMI